MMRDWGMLSPRTAPVEMHVNGVEKGVYYALEPVDASFVESRGLLGDLFFEAWPNSPDADSYDAALIKGAKGTKAGQPLADWFVACEACSSGDCSHHCPSNHAELHG